MSGEVLFTLAVPKPCDWLTQNSTRKMHWRTLNRLQTEWKEATYWHALRMTPRVPVGGPPGGFPPAILEFTFHFTLNRGRDPHNFAATQKPVVDAIANKKYSTLRWWPDDTPDHLSVPEPLLSVTAHGQEGLVIRAIAR